MYISAQTTPNMKEVIVWERTKKGRITKRYPAPYYFYVKDEDGEHLDIYDNRLKKCEFENYQDFKDARSRYSNFGEKLYESDIPFDQKILSEHYYGKELEVDSHISFFDIETDYDRQQGYARPDDAYAPISAISLFHFWSQKTYMLLLSPHLSEYEPGPVWNMDMLSDETKSRADIRFFDSEAELLLEFFELIEDTDVISGWNSDSFDVPYVYERCLRLFGDRGKKLWGFEGAKLPRYREVEGKFGQVDQVLEIFGREHIDFMKAFQKLEMVKRPSYSLENISDEVLPELPKLEYEGTLYSLYREDFEQFVRYGIRDSECLDGFEKKLGYVRIAIQMTHGSTTHLKNVLGTLKVVECAMVNYCHYDMNRIAPDTNKDFDMNAGKFAGAIVLKPKVGMHTRTAAIDITSLYPSGIRTVNISPEKVIGQFFENHRAYEEIYSKSSKSLTLRTEDGDVEVRTGAEWYDWLREQNYTISGYGTIFNQDSQGFFPAILTGWFGLRKKYNKEKNRYKDLLHSVDETDPNHSVYFSKFEYYHRLQYIYKILLNSAYGSLGNKYFKFFDVRLAESTTRSGRAILMHMVGKVSEVMDGTYAPPTESTDEKGKPIYLPNSETIVYGDTDSTFFDTYADTLDEAKVVCGIVVKKVNDSFEPFVKEAFNSNHNQINTGLDLIASRSIFIKPKMYIMHLDHFDGDDVDMMKVMGLQIKKTSIPKPIGIQLTKYVESLLKGENWREIQEKIVAYRDVILDSPTMQIGLPKGIKGLEAYEDEWSKNPTCRLPGGHAAAIFYNTCLDQYGDTESLRIVSGSNMRVYYLTKKFGRFQSIAIPTDMKRFPPWFEEHFEELVDRTAQGIRLIDKPLSNILDAIGERIPTRKTLLFDSLVEY